MAIKDNIYLKLGSRAVMTPIIEPVILALEPYFKEANLYATVVSGLRDQNDQLRIIRGYLNTKNLFAKYPDAMTCGVNEKNADGTYKWQMAWSNLLNVGIIINPPLPATCLMDYINKSGENKKGKIIDASVHFKGTAFDIAGGGDGITNELAVIKKALGNVKGLVGYVAERNNNCVHIDCKLI
jgi:hypothetical protein